MLALNLDTPAESRWSPVVMEQQAAHLTISLSGECLARLLRERQLCVEQFDCVDNRSRQLLRRLLLKNLC